MKNIKKLKRLLEACKTKDKLNGEKIIDAASQLSRRELKEFLFLLKRQRLAEKVIVETQVKPNPSTLAMLKKVFKDKDIIIKIQNELIGGLRLHMLDAVLDLSTLGKLRRIGDKI